MFQIKGQVLHHVRLHLKLPGWLLLLCSAGTWNKAKTRVVVLYV